MFQRICGLQKPKLAAFILAAGLWGSYRYVVKEVTTCNHGSCLRRYDTLVCTHPLVYASTPLLSWMHWNVLYHTLFLLQSDGLTSPGANAERLLLELCALTESDRAWELFCKAGLKYIITTQETREDILSIRSDGELKSAALMTVLNAAAPVLSPAVSSVWVMCCLTQEWMAKDGNVNSGC